MTAETFCEHFATFSDAPNGIVKLRELILQLAVQGKLVPQDENDEPASSLRKRLAVQADERQRAGRTTRSKELPAVKPSEVPFHLPHDWEWVRFGELAAEVEYGTSQKASEIGGDVPVLRMNAIRNGKVILEKSKFVSSAIDDLPRLYLKNGDILFNRTNSFELVGKSGVFIGEDDKFTFASYLIRGSLLPELSPDFVVLAMNASYFRKTQIEPELTQQCGQANFNGTKLRNSLIPLPPLAEQKRIVEKVDQLLGLCDELAARQAAQREKRQRLVGATLERLVSPQTSRHLACRGGLTASAPLDENTTGAKANEPPGQARWRVMQDDAHRLRNHFDQLFDTPTTIPQLRQTILQLAYSGRLVDQQSSDGAGAEIISRIGAAQRLEPAKNLRRSRKSEETLDPLNCPGVFPVPESWAWSYLDCICEMIGDVDHNMPKAVPVGVIFLSAKDLKDDGTLDFSDPKMISEEDYERLSRKIQIRRGDIVYSRIGARLGKARLVEVDTRFLISYSCCLIRVLDEFVDRRFVQMFLDSKVALNQAHKGAQSIGVPDLGLGEIKAFQIPLPPLAEQKRIVTKVTELLSLCDALEAKLTQAESASTQLLSAAVHHLLNGAATNV